MAPISTVLLIKMKSAASSSWLETLSLSSDRRRAIEELIKGRELALQLRNLIHESAKTEGSQVIINPDLVANILSSFSNSLSILKNGDSDEVSQVEARTQLSSPCWEAYVKPEDSGESSKSSTIKDRRGCYKRRKRAEPWTQHCSALIDDGHAWRKYGQKVILNAKFPRSYFRCTHKFDQGCQVTKVVQRIEEEPPVYRTTYYGHHTCKNLLKASQLILDSTASGDQCPMISLGGTQITDKGINRFYSSFPSGKQVSKEIQAPSDMTQTQNQSSTSGDPLVSLEFAAFESTGGHTTTLSVPGDVISGGNSSSCTATVSDHSLDLSVDFDDVLEFEF